MAELEYPDRLRYPEEDGDYGARVIFTIKKDEPTGTNDGIRESQRTITENRLKDIRKQQEELVNERRQENITSSGRLAEPALPIITKFGTGYVLSVGYQQGSEASKYYDFVNKGVKGTSNVKADAKSPYSFKPNKKPYLLAQ